MNWATFYLVCFVVGFAFSVLSLLMGSGKLHLHGLHLSHGGPHVGATHGAGVTHGPVPHGGGAATRAHSVTLRSTQVSFFNLFTLMAFLAWFGGTGYLLTQYSRLWFLVGLGIATVSGLIGASIVFWFLAKVLLGHERPLDPADYELVGVLGKVSSSIREGGTGEIIFSQQGTRKTSGARSADGIAIPKGTEVVVTRYDRGIAYVRRWEDMTQ